MTGAASVEGTRRYAQRAIDEGIPASAYRGLGRTGLVNSSLGFGSYRIDDRTPEHASALDKALRSGVNLIDTSTNYTDGSSESCIGNVLARQQREELIVVSKVGYVQEQALATARTREQRGSAFPEMVKYTEGCWHCIHPEFLADQLGRSLGRLRVEKVDVYLLHNPEYFFKDASKRCKGASLETLRDQFYDRIQRAFSYLEDEVRRGRIGFLRRFLEYVRRPGERPGSNFTRAHVDDRRGGGARASLRRSAAPREPFRERRDADAQQCDRHPNGSGVRARARPCGLDQSAAQRLLQGTARPSRGRASSVNCHDAGNP